MCFDRAREATALTQTIHMEDMTMRISSVLTLLALLSLTACQPPEPSEPVEMTASDAAGLTADDRAAIGPTREAWVKRALAGDGGALAATYAEDAVLLPPNHEAVEGRAAIQAYFETFPPVSDMQLHPMEVDGVGDVAYVRGHYVLTMTPEGSDPINDSGHYLEVRRKQADGSWLTYRDIYNSELSLQGAGLGV